MLLFPAFQLWDTPDKELPKYTRLASMFNLEFAFKALQYVKMN